MSEVTHKTTDIVDIKLDRKLAEEVRQKIIKKKKYTPFKSISSAVKEVLNDFLYYDDIHFPPDDSHDN